MASEPEVIHKEIEETRSDLAKKLVTLEGEIQETVRSAKETVEETIENVTESVQETVDSVKKTFDLEYQMQQRPWTLLAGATVAGFLVGAVLLRSRRHYHHPEEHEGWFGGGRDFYPHDQSSRGGIDTRSSSWTQPASSPPPQPEPPRHEEPRHEHHGPSMVRGLMSTFGDELNLVKEAAIGYGVGVLRDMIKDALPALGEKIEKVMDSATHKLGGEPIHGRVMGEEHPDQGQPQSCGTGFQAR